MPEVALRTLQYYGGKSPFSGVSKWIASILPRGKVYIEACAGMCGVLLSRSPAPVEIINDLDDRIMSFWRAVRDHGDELKAYLDATPYSETAFHKAKDGLDSSNPVIKGASVAVRLCLGWKPSLDDDTFQRYTGINRARVWNSYKDALPHLIQRMLDVELHCAGASKIILRYGDFEDAVIYVDPPYPAAPDGYKHQLSDGFSDLLKGWNRKALVAVSGYDGDWDHLGFPDKRTLTRNIGVGGNGQHKSEALYLSRPVSGKTINLFDHA